MKPFSVRTYEYSHECGRDIITHCEYFNTEDEALQHAHSLEKTNNNRIVVSGDFGYSLIAKI